MILLRAWMMAVLLALPALADPADDKVAEGLVALADRDVVKAMAAFTAALEADPGHVAAAYERGRLLALIGEPANAIADFTTAILGKPEFGRAYVERAQAKLTLKDVAGAMADFDAAVTMAPEDHEVHVARAAFRLRIGNIKGAKADLENARAVADAATALKIEAMLRTLARD